MAVAELELTLKISAPQVIGRDAFRQRCAVGAIAFPACALDQAMTIGHGMDGAFGGNPDVAGQSSHQKLADFARAPMWLVALEIDNQAFELLLTSKLAFMGEVDVPLQRVEVRQHVGIAIFVGLGEDPAEAFGRRLDEAAGSSGRTDLETASPGWLGSYHLALLIWTYSPKASDQLGVQCDRGVEHL